MGRLISLIGNYLLLDVNIYSTQPIAHSLKSPPNNTRRWLQFSVEPAHQHSLRASALRTFYCTVNARDLSLGPMISFVGSDESNLDSACRGVSNFDGALIPVQKGSLPTVDASKLSAIPVKSTLLVRKDSAYRGRFYSAYRGRFQNEFTLSMDEKTLPSTLPN